MKCKVYEVIPEYKFAFEQGRKRGAVEQKEKDKIDFIRLEVIPKSKKNQFRVFFKDGTEQVFELEVAKEK